jgi:MoaA/NifB/PqqE/SkfB family radical SAM enzyme
VVEYIKKKKIRCQLFTNFTLANRQSLRQLADSNLDSLVVSVWAATAKTYALLHPNKTERQFEEIKENLMYLSEIKKKPDRPSLCIHNVINAMNCREFRQMGDFACEVGANEISFSVLDSVPPVIDPLLLTAEQRNSILSDCRRLTGRIPIRDIDEFTRRLSSKGAACGEYDRDAVEQFPCYAGWLSSRIKSDGEVNPCLKSHRIPMGNIYRQSFQEIWNSFAQQEFRMRSLSFTKSAPYFFKVGNNGRDTPGCYRVCDDLVRNSSLYRRIALSPITRVLIKTAGLEEGLVRLFRKMSRLARIVQLVFIVVVYSVGLKFYRLVKKMTVFPGE